MKRILFTLIISIFIPGSAAFGYDPDTHFDLSEAAVNASVLSTDSTVLSDLGLNSLDAPDQTFPNSAGDEKGITQLVQDGAVFEDNGTRPLNHFYNPLTNEPLVHLVCSLPLLSCNPSPDWALEEQTTYSKQDDSFRDTRQFFLNALTLQSKTARETAWGRTFQGLGQIMHHLQDMAQPQHVRNDPHQESSYLPSFFENPSLYEHYTAQTGPDDVRGRVRTSYFGGYTPVYSTDDPATFNSPRKLWHTGNGKGIADYTNRGFVSAGTNFDQIAGRIMFPQPDITSSTVTIEDKTALCQEISEHSGAPLPRDGAGQALPCLMAFIGTDVEDSYRPDQSGQNAKTATFSIFDAELTKYFQIRLATLNKFNFEAAYPFLMKRAVGYSAGLINYFFRGKIDLAPDPNIPGQHLIKNLGPETLKGAFALYYDDQNGNRYPVVPDPADTTKAVEWLTPAAGLAPQEGMLLPAFAPPTNPAAKAAEEYILIFKGEMGEEKLVNGFVGAVAAQKVSIVQSRFLLITTSGSYKSQDLDKGWERIGDGLGNISDISSVGRVGGDFVTDDLIFVNDRYASWQSTDGGGDFVKVFNSADSSTIAYLGGTELLANVFSVDTVARTLYSSSLGAGWQIQSEGDQLSLLRYVGNGEVFSNLEVVLSNTDVVQTAGLTRSLDKGITWSAVKPTVDGHVFDNCNGGDPCRLFQILGFAWNQVEGEGNVFLAGGGVAVSGGGEDDDPPFTCCLWKSTDGGNTWRHISIPQIGNVASIALSPTGEGLLVLASDNSTVPLSELYRSTDAGETWELAENPGGGESIGVVYLGNHLE
jgi:hypothetical protein